LNRGERGDFVFKNITFFSLKSFYLDRIWLKAYPYFFKWLRTGLYRDVYYQYRENGVFKKWTSHFFDLYRTIRCLKVALKRKIEIDKVEECVDILKYGEKSFIPFEKMFWNIYKIGDLVLEDWQILQSKFISYPIVREDKVYYEKLFYLPINNYMIIAVKPFISRFTPHMIRVFLNAIEYAKTKVKFDYSDYSFNNTNWIDPLKDGFDYEGFWRVNWSIIDYIKNELPRRFEEYWKIFFGDNEKLEIKVSQVEICSDTYIDKIKLLYALKFIVGRHKTLKYDSNPNEGVLWGSDIGVKYYVTVSKNFQVKVYSKAYNNKTGKVLNRLEFTRGVKKEVSSFNVNDIWDNKLVEVLRDFQVALMDEKAALELVKLIDPLIPSGVENKDLHRVFLIDLLLHGQVKGSNLFRSIAEVYKRRGLIEVKGRGRNSFYRLKPEYMVYYKQLREALKEIPLDLLKLPPEKS
jgi:hypothetical protein